MKSLITLIVGMILSFTNAEALTPRISVTPPLPPDIISTQTTVGTQTTGTTTTTATPAPPRIPQIVAIEILVDKKEIKAGESIILSTREVWDNGTSLTSAGKDYIASGGAIVDNIFRATQAGEYEIKTTAAEYQSSVKVKVLPGDQVSLEIRVKESVVYGRQYAGIDNLFVYAGSDEYGNQTTTKPFFVINRNEPGVICSWLNGTDRTGMSQMLRPGMIADSNGNILFYECGTFTVKTTYGSTEFIVSLDKEFQGVEPWGDYKLKDFETGVVIVRFFDSFDREIIIPSDWEAMIKNGSFFQKLQAISWFHYRVLRVRAEEKNRIAGEQFIGLIRQKLEEHRSKQ